MVGMKLLHFCFSVDVFGKTLVLGIWWGALACLVGGLEIERLWVLLEMGFMEFGRFWKGVLVVLSWGE